MALTVTMVAREVVEIVAVVDKHALIIYTTTIIIIGLVNMIFMSHIQAANVITKWKDRDDATITEHKIDS